MKLGEIQDLEVVKIVDFGVYVADSVAEEAGKILLPKKQVPPDTKLGDLVNVFVYRDSDDRLIATTNTPKMTLGQVALLTVQEVTAIGAFLDFGLEKDLLLPFKQQTKRVKVGEKVLAALYIDKSDRLCATMNVYPYLHKNSPYHKNDQVGGWVYEISEEFGAFVAVDYQYSALIPRNELYGTVSIGQEITARVSVVKEDGKLDLSIRDKAYLQIAKDTERIMNLLQEYDGQLPFTDKDSPQLIERETQMSKKEFKRAIGSLLKQGKVKITSEGIRRVAVPQKDS
ncbi:MAG: S1 RNA-binding domain-containing protein [Clostridium sp.]|jgi:predicted RNA-binding protein (virulence factor B family)|nr:S1 RNA-binding domain-containing protein [Clostridium sp.]